MPLILAIEPDRKQTSRLAALAKGPLRKVHLLIVDSAVRAIAELQERVPDLILTSPLLSPKDDAALTQRLRELDSAGIQVPTLTIPVLAPPTRRGLAHASGLLKRLAKGDDGDHAAGGCDPAVFAAQIIEY